MMKLFLPPENYYIFKITGFKVKRYSPSSGSVKGRKTDIFLLLNIKLVKKELYFYIQKKWNEQLL